MTKYCEGIPGASLLPENREAELADMWKREAEAFRAVLEGAKYQRIDEIARQDADTNRLLGAMVADATKTAIADLRAHLATARADALRAAAIELEANWPHKAIPEMRDAILALIDKEPSNGS